MENLDRITKIKNILSQYWKSDVFTLNPLNTDASSRKYYRSTCSDKSIIVMDDDGCKWKPGEFALLSDFLLKNDVYVPEVYYKNLTEGILLLEDLGDNSVRTLLSLQSEEDLYLESGLAVAKVVNIENKPEYVKDFSKQKLLEDIKLFTEWYFPCALGYPLAEEKKNEFLSLIDKFSDMAYKIPSRLMLWDYHIDNIMVTPANKFAIIDFQDAMWGPLTYDIASLLAADRMVASNQTILKTKEAFFGQLSGINREDFEDSFAFMYMFRHMRVLGRFTTLSIVNQKEKYLQFIPQTWKALERILQYPKLAEVKKWIDENIPEQSRGLPKRKPVTEAVVLAAGRGSRMRELTDNLPKPLVEIGNKALIDYNFERLKNINIEKFVVNLCYKGNMIKDHILKKHPDLNIVFSEEEEALETGGGVKKALPLLKEQAFFVSNSDVFFIDKGYKSALWKMIDEWDENKYDILILLQDLKDICGDKSIGDYRIDKNGHPERNENKISGFPYMFSGISIVNRKIFENVTEEKFSLRDLFDVAQKNEKLGFVINDADFFHVGTPEALKEAKMRIKVKK